MNMSNVIEFKKKEKPEIVCSECDKEAQQTQTGVGEAFCMQCGHSWVAVAPTGTTELECPSCKTMNGLFKFKFMLQEGTLIRVCNCGNMLFYLTQEGHMCANCGIYQQYS